MKIRRLIASGTALLFVLAVNRRRRGQQCSDRYLYLFLSKCNFAQRWRNTYKPTDSVGGHIMLSMEKIITMCCILLATSSAVAAASGDLHTPSWPLYMNGVPVDASANRINLPFCWQASYYVPIKPHGSGLYNTGSGLQFAYLHDADCFAANAVLQWPDVRISVSKPWSAMHIALGGQPLELYCTPTGKDYIANSATHFDLGALYRCQWPTAAEEYSNG